MKKIIACLMAIMTAMVFSVCTACAEGDKLQIVATTFAPYDWVRQMLGEEASHAELTLLTKNGVDMHSYQPTADDIIAISTCDVFVYVGGESDAWVEPALETAHNEHMTVINLMDVLGDKVKQEAIVEGMAHEHEDHDDDDDHDDHEESEPDEHVWLSLLNAQSICEYIADTLSSIDPTHREIYQANFATYNGDLSALHTLYQQAVNEGTVKTLLFADRFPFRYLTDDYGLDYFAAFPGCSAETEASFETIVFLAQKVDELQLKHIMVIDSSDGAIAETVSQSTRDKDQTILSLNSMQSVTAADAAQGVSYLSIMKENLETLKTALQ